MADFAAEIDRARQWLKAARAVTVLTGAGISAESGVPTFRGANGLWKNHRPEDLATPEAFANDPATAWEWYDLRRRKIAEARPNAGHLALANLENRFETFTLVTQNVDGLHERAGSRHALTLHGSIWRVRCVECGRETGNRDTPIQIPPHCMECAGLLRPAVVWFGEALDPDVFQRAWRAAKFCDVFFMIGASGLVQPAASLAEVARRGRRAKLIEINPAPGALRELFDLTFSAPAGEILPLL